MLRLCSILFALFLIALLPGIAQTTVKGGPGFCSSHELANVADSVAAQFDTHQFIFIGSTHGGIKLHDFELCLLSRPSFQQRVTDVLVEFANPFHQELIDRYLLALENVPENLLTQVWFGTDYPKLWATLPQIPEFFAVVQTINKGLKPSKRIRVLGGNEPINYATLKTPEDLAKYPYKNNYAAHVITEHFANSSQKLLVIYGEGHNHHNGGLMMSNLETKIDVSKLFVIGTIADLDMAEKDRIARFGNTAGPFYLPEAHFPVTRPLPGDFFYAEHGNLKDYIDAVICLGPEADRDLKNSIQLTPAQESELARRESIRVDLKVKYGQKQKWFLSHPNDIPKRPS